ncbi:MAG: hypothetical protein KAI73_01305 [Rhodospirillaceae bacterium]|nr:hypothetical protein [Rhodospirillaceae bacterium]
MARKSGQIASRNINHKAGLAGGPRSAGQSVKMRIKAAKNDVKRFCGFQQMD